MGKRKKKSKRNHKRKPGRPRGVVPIIHAAGLRSTEEYSAWLERFAYMQKMTKACLIERALADYAKAISYPIAPPNRLKS